MKRMIALLTIGIVTMTMCTTPDTSPVESCEIPATEVDTLHDGSQIYWDCDWEASYKAGRVNFIKNKNGEVTMVSRSISN